MIKSLTCTICGAPLNPYTMQCTYCGTYFEFNDHPILPDDERILRPGMADIVIAKRGAVIPYVYKKYVSYEALCRSYIPEEEVRNMIKRDMAHEFAQKFIEDDLIEWRTIKNGPESKDERIEANIRVFDKNWRF